MIKLILPHGWNTQTQKNWYDVILELQTKVAKLEAENKALKAKVGA